VLTTCATPRKRPRDLLPGGRDTFYFALLGFEDKLNASFRWAQAVGKKHGKKVYKRPERL